MLGLGLGLRMALRRVAAVVAGVAEYLLTEAGDNLTTEDGDQLTLE